MPNKVSAESKTNVATDWLFLALLLITTIAVFVPLLPAMPGEGLDASWVFGMNQAVAQELVLGRDIIFTYGPYSSIATAAFHPATDHLMIWGALYLGISFCFAAFLTFNASGWHLKSVLLVTLATLVYIKDVLFLYYALLVGIYIFKTILLETKKITSTADWNVLAATLFTPFGLIFLIKGSLIACMLIIALSALLVGQKGNWKTAAIICISPLISFITFWLLAGQPLNALPLYLTSMVSIINGYTGAMAAKGDFKEILLYVLTFIVFLWALLFEAKARFFSKTIGLLIFSVVPFLAFKAGFIRHDGHALIAGTIILLAGLAVSAIISSNRARAPLIAAIFVGLYIDSNYENISVPSMLISAQLTYSNAWRGLTLRIGEKGNLARDFAERLRNLNDKGGLPILEGSTDIYSYDQSYLIASGNKWNPRPIMQSYSAYTPLLLTKNQEHLVGKNKPDNIFFKVQPIDGRIPSLEDGASWPILLGNYQPIQTVNGFLVLKQRRPIEGERVYENHLTEQIGLFDEKIDVPIYEKLIFSKIKLKPTLLGRVASFFFKTTELEIKLTMEDGTVKIYRFIPGMAETAFLVSPLVESTQDFGLLYANPKYLEEKEVKSIFLSMKNGRILWEKEFQIEFLSLDFPRATAVPDLYSNISMPIEARQFRKISSVNKCDGSIDSVNGATLPSSFKARSLIKVNGWLAKSAEKGDLPDSTYLVLTKRSGERVFMKTAQSQRPDVAAYFKLSQMGSSGYAATADVSKLIGSYTLGLAYLENGSLNICSQFNIPGLIDTSDSSNEIR